MIVYHELMSGAAQSRRREANEEAIALFLTTRGLDLLAFLEDAREAADIRAHQRREGTLIGPYDVLIAAQAHRAGAPLVASSCCEFGHVPGLIVTGWAA